MYFFKKYKNRMIVAGVAIILIFIMGFTSSERDKITSIENTVGNVVGPINKTSFNIRYKVSNFFDTILNITKIRDENENLRKKVAKLEDKNREQEDIIGKYNFLKEESELKTNTNYNLLLGQVISKEPGNWYDRFIIDKGKNDGVKKDDTVIQGVKVDGKVVKEGVIGRVSDVGDNWAKVVSIVDELSSVSFKTLRTQEGGVLSGNIDNTLEGYLFDHKAKVKVGDKLYTSGLGRKYKKDIYIGKIKKIEDVDEELKKKIIVEPAVDFKKIYRVFVILD